jgi:hypothetical protein
LALISPRGVVTERRPLLRELGRRTAFHGADDFRFGIEVRNFRHCRSEGRLCPVTYEQW